CARGESSWSPGYDYW
nr:immunoglobulin heavy chain junction region [Macaca mulatta]MOV49483.1 immunoglobulin heavy chain junction region [Macaca mulatta]MOV49487.1 immunoglobulin heavy chain junction region [Macaca mulatta]MOV49560.1 immunoglobulin heavy chain junction region [Macaca mulatta]MOV49712.1 immunoglobulin heavy chain junction region [Macaca mulatta]